MERRRVLRAAGGIVGASAVSAVAYSTALDDQPPGRTKLAEIFIENRGPPTRVGVTVERNGETVLSRFVEADGDSSIGTVKTPVPRTWSCDPARYRIRAQADASEQRGTPKNPESAVAEIVLDDERVSQPRIVTRSGHVNLETVGIAKRTSCGMMDGSEES